jgi:hypothetical protein
MQRSTQRKPIAQARSVILAGLALLVSGTAMAQQPVYICDSDITMDALGEQPFFINEPIPIVITLGAGDVNDGTNDGLLTISSFDYKPDCDAGSDFATCAAAGNTVQIVTADADIGGTCGVAFTTSQVDPSTIRFDPDPDVELVPAEGPDKTCTVEFEIVVVGVEPGTTGILEWGGWTESQAVCSYPGTDTTLNSAASGSLFFPLSTERATFRVTKDFTDDSANTADVYLRCNAGLPLEQEFTLDDDGFVTFVVREFQAGQMDCRVYEDPIDGYTGSYAAGGTGSAALIDDDDTGCIFEGVQAGEFTCDVTNAIDGIDIEVTKQWLGVNEGDFELVAEAEYSCFNVFASSQGGTTTTLTGTLSFDGMVDSDTIQDLYPAPDGSYCTVSEPVVEEFVEADASDCANVPVEPDASCILYNTVFFEGIPTLSQYGMAVLALLMFGIGAVGLRRFV